MARGGGVSNRPKIHFRCSFFLLFFFLEEGLFFIGRCTGWWELPIGGSGSRGRGNRRDDGARSFFFHFCLVFGSSINQLMTRLWLRVPGDNSTVRYRFFTFCVSMKSDSTWTSKKSKMSSRNQHLTVLFRNESKSVQDGPVFECSRR